MKTKLIQKIKKVVVCSICGKKIYQVDCDKHMHAKEMGWDKTGLRTIREKVIDFIQDQQSHEVENKTILEKIPNLVEYLTDQAISQSKEELVEEIKYKFGTMVFDDTGKNKLANIMNFRKEQRKFLEDLNKK